MHMNRLKYSYFQLDTFFDFSLTRMKEKCAKNQRTSKKQPQQEYQWKASFFFYIGFNFRLLVRERVEKKTPSKFNGQWHARGSAKLNGMGDTL